MEFEGHPGSKAINFNKHMERIEEKGAGLVGNIEIDVFVTEESKVSNEVDDNHRGASLIGNRIRVEGND